MIWGKTAWTGRRRGPLLLAVLMTPPALLPAAAATMPPVEMKVVDDADGAPIAEVAALFLETAREGTITGHGGRGAILFAAEAVSAPGGELRFAKQEFSGYPFLLNTVHENPSMLLLKPGYAPLFLVNQSHIIPTLAEASIWEYTGKTVRMKKAAATDGQNLGYLVNLRTNSVLGFGGLSGSCTWKHTPHTVVAADRMFPGPSTTLRTLLMNDALFVRQGCGSPKAFFAPYLRP